MATYYRWRKSTVNYISTCIDSSGAASLTSVWVGTGFTTDTDDGTYTLTNAEQINLQKGGKQYLEVGQCLAEHETAEEVYKVYSLTGVPYVHRSQYGPRYYYDISQEKNHPDDNPSAWIYDYQENYFRTSPKDFLGYVYSTSPSAYPNGGVSGDYYYDQRTTVTSPTQPTDLTYPNPITTQKVTVSWQAATSNTNYPVDHYIVMYYKNSDEAGDTYITAGTTSGTSMEVTLPSDTTSVTFVVQAVDTNGQKSSGIVGPEVPVYLAPTLTVPQMLMQGQQATINWTAIEGADSYTLQRKSSADTDWTQVYSGANTTFSETAGTWTTVQYRVQAVFDGTPGGWATSAEISVVSASALVISGQDGDLGTLVNDVPYTISTDTGNQITATITANGAVIFSGNVGNSVADVIPVLDLINGEGTIVIEASVTASSGPVSAVRTWTYTKTMMTFPNAGSIAELTKDGKVMWPETLAEAVRIPGGKTLDQAMGFPCQIYTGSYVGTGTSGENNPNTLTFPFEPKLWGLTGMENKSDGKLRYTDQLILVPWGLQGPIRLIENYDVTASYSGNTVSYYSASPGSQANQSGHVYHYVALG